MTAIYCIILANGAGNKLYPLTDEIFPKKLNCVDKEYSLFQRTFLNIASYTDDKNIITITGLNNFPYLKQDLKVLQRKFQRRNEYKIIQEPIRKESLPETAVSIKYTMENLHHSEKQPIIITVPNDIVISDRVKFSEAATKGIKLALEGYIVSFGSLTNEINENNSYIKARKNPKISEIEPDSLKCTKFIDKPNKKQKKELKGKFYLNSGIYMYRTDIFFEELKRYSKDDYKLIQNINFTGNIPALEDYKKLKDISIEKGILENTKKLVTVPLETDWKAIDNWERVREFSQKDENGNCFIGNTVDIDSKNSFVYSPSKLTATIGLNNKTVVVYNEKIFICDNKELDKEKKHKKNNTSSKTQYYQWGYCTTEEESNSYITRTVTVNENEKFSLVQDSDMISHWSVLEGEVEITKEENTYKLQAGESISIKPDEIYSAQNTGNCTLKLLEVQCVEAPIVVKEEVGTT